MEFGPFPDWFDHGVLEDWFRLRVPSHTYEKMIPDPLTSNKLVVQYRSNDEREHALDLLRGKELYYTDQDNERSQIYANRPMTLQQRRRRGQVCNMYDYLTQEKQIPSSQLGLHKASGRIQFKKRPLLTLRTRGDIFELDVDDRGVVSAGLNKEELLTHFRQL